MLHNIHVDLSKLVCRVSAKLNDYPMTSMTSSLRGFLITLKMAGRQKTLSYLLMITGLSSVVFRTSAAVVYTEDFSVDSPANMNTIGWNAWLSNDTEGVDDLTSHTINSGTSYEPVGVTQNGYGFVKTDVNAGYTITDGPGMIFTSEPSASLQTTDIASLSKLSISINADGSPSDQALGRFVIQIDNQWYASSASATSTTNEGASGTWNTFELTSDFTSGSNWHLMTATTGSSGVISVGEQATGTLSGSISNFGFYMELGNSGDHFRVDNYSVTVVPEPSSVGITSIALTGLFYFFRHRKNA